MILIQIIFSIFVNAFSFHLNDKILPIAYTLIFHNPKWFKTYFIEKKQTKNYNLKTHIKLKQIRIMIRKY